MSNGGNQQNQRDWDGWRGGITSDIRHIKENTQLQLNNLHEKLDSKFDTVCAKIDRVGKVLEKHCDDDEREFENSKHRDEKLQEGINDNKDAINDNKKTLAKWSVAIAVIIGGTTAGGSKLLDILGGESKQQERREKEDVRESPKVESSGQGQDQEER